MPTPTSSSPSTTTPATPDREFTREELVLYHGQQKVLEGIVAGWDPTPGKVHALMATWVEGKGWLVTRRGITVCGPIAQLPEEEMFMLEMRGSYRAIRARVG